MSHRCLLGVDLGTSATKAALYREDGLLLAEAGLEVPLHTPAPGVVEQESDDFYQTAAQAVQRCLRQSGVDPRTVVAVAFDSQMAGVGTIDEQFRPATRFDSWLDMRCEPWIRWLDESMGDEVTRRTGCAPTCNHAPKMLWWQHERPTDYARIAKFVMPAGYVAGRLAGLHAEDAFIDHTFLHFSGLSDAEAGAWSLALIAATGLDAAKLPRIVAPWHVAG
ncbi:MAG: xylulokinase, partial [Caldilineaceae bacterium]